MNAPGALAPHAARRPEASTGRDFALDVFRVGSLLFVAIVHSSHLMFFFDARCPDPARCPVSSTLDDYSALWRGLYWFLYTMPLVFFVGGASNATSLKAQESWGGWMLRRVRRMYRPLAWFLPLMLVLAWVFSQFYEMDSTWMGQQWLALLWYLAIYPVYFACTPLLLKKIQTPRRTAIVVTACLLLLALPDLLRLEGNPSVPLLFVSAFVMFFVPFSLGSAYRRGMVSTRAGLWVLILAGAVFAALYSSGVYSDALDGDPHGRIRVPSLLFGVYTVMWSGFAVVIAPQVRKLGGIPSVRRAVSTMNSGAVTLYLGHWVALRVIDTVFLAAKRYPTRFSPPPFWSEKLPVLLLFVPLFAAVFFAFRKAETRPLPWWDAPVSVTGWRSPLVGGLLVLSGLALLASTPDFEKGVAALPVFFLLLLAARLVAGIKGRRPPST